MLRPLHPRLYLIIQCHRWRSIVRLLLLSIPFSRHFIPDLFVLLPPLDLSNLLLWYFFLYRSLDTSSVTFRMFLHFFMGKLLYILLGYNCAVFRCPIKRWVLNNMDHHVQQKHCANIFLVIWLLTLDLVVDFLLFPSICNIEFNSHYIIWRVNTKELFCWNLLCRLATVGLVYEYGQWGGLYFQTGLC